MKFAVTKTVAETRAAAQAARAGGRLIGLVPTMGALHEGHASLIRAARAATEFVVVSIFINPTQFGPNEDLDRYPRTLPADLDICRQLDVDLVFAPPPAEIYSPAHRSYVEVHELQELLCGRSRPTHFRGVATVVLKLFNIVGPDIAYFGQKDAQQARIIEQMVDDLNVPVHVHLCPIVRAADGLALSSRNQYLNLNQRKCAVGLFQSLEEIRRLIEEGERDAHSIATILHKRLSDIPGGRLDYASVVSYTTLQPLDVIQGKVLVALAVYFGETRLIDNLLMDVQP